MNSWKKISDLITFSTKGITPSYVEDSSIIVLNQKCIRNGVIDYSLSQFTDDTKQISEQKFVKKGDILINSTGVGTAGRCSFVSELPLNKKLITDSHILLLRCNSYYEARCLSYLLFSFEKNLMSFMTGSSGQGELDKVAVLNILTKLPVGLTTQQKIAKVLSNLDAKIELNKKINEELEAMAKTLYNYWFVQFDFPNTDGKPYKSSGGKMVWDVELKREIPQGWEVKRVEDVLAKEISFKKIPTSEYLDKGLIPIIDQSTDFIAGFTNDIKYKIDCEIPRIIFGDHTRILKLINFDFARGADGTQVLLSNNKQNPQHLFYYSLLKIDLSNYGYARHFKFLKDSKIILPEEMISQKFEKLVDDYYKKIKSNIFQNQELASLRDWLLPMLMNGQVSVGEVSKGYVVKEDVLGMVAEPAPLFENDLNIDDLNASIAAIYYIENKKNGYAHAKTGFHKTLFFAKTAMKQSILQNIQFQRYLHGTFSKQVANAIENNPFLTTERISRKLEIFKLKEDKNLELKKWMDKKENKSFVKSIEQLVDLYQDPIISNDIDKMELMNTVYKIMLDINSTDFNKIWKEMKGWSINKEGSLFKSDKFTLQDTKDMIKFIVRIGWYN